MVPFLRRARHDPSRPRELDAAQPRKLKHWLIVQLGLSGVGWAIVAAGIRCIV
jgi:hypothetical protein